MSQPIEKFSQIRPMPGQGLRVMKSKLLTALGATGVLRPYIQNPERILERKILLQDAFNPNPSSAPIPPPSQSSLLTGLASYWKLDEGAGVNRADSIGANTLSEGGAAVPNTTGIILNMANCTGGALNKWFQINSNATLQFGAGVEKSFAGWFIVTTVTIEMIILSKWNDIGGDREYCLSSNAGSLSFQVRNLADGANVTVTSAVTIVPGPPYHVAFGFDNTNQVIWIQVDGETRVTTPCTGIRASNQQFRIGSAVDRGGTGPHAIDGFLDEFAMWNRVLTNTEVQQLSGSYSLPGIQANVSVGRDNANRWNTAVQGNGGAALSAGTVSAMAGFVDSAVAASIYNKIWVFNPFAPDGLIAAFTPWSRVGSRTVWVNHNFLVGDLSVNGLAGNGTTKYIDVAFSPSGIFTLNSTFIATYSYVIGNNGNTEVGLQDAGGNACSLFPDIGGNAFFDTYNTTLGQGRLRPVANGLNGFYLGSRTSAGASSLYFANSTNPFAAMGSIATSGGALSAINIYAFAINNSGVPLICNPTTSFLSFGSGLTSGEGQALFNAVQAMRVALGGGVPMNLVHIGIAGKLAFAGMIGTALGSVIAQALPRTQITGDWVVDVRTVCAVGFVVIGGSWHASRWMTKVNDRLSTLEQTLENLPCQQPGALHCSAKEKPK